MDIRECYRLCVSDYNRYVEHSEVKSGNMMMIWNALTTWNHRCAFSFWLRMGRCDNFVIRIISKAYYFRLSRKFGLQVPFATEIGEGLYIGHGIGIIINPKTKIGKNCNISQFTTIGNNKGIGAEIGENVYIGPNVCIVEDVKIGNNVKIGAGTVVVHNVPENCTSVGNPNRIIVKK